MSSNIFGGIGLGGRQDEEDNIFAPIKPQVPDRPPGYAPDDLGVEPSIAITQSGAGSSTRSFTATERESTPGSLEPLQKAAGATANVFGKVGKVLEKVPGVPEVKAALQVGGGSTGALYGGLLDPGAWWRAYHANESDLQARYEKGELGIIDRIRALPGVGQVAGEYQVGGGQALEPLLNTVAALAEPDADAKPPGEASTIGRETLTTALTLGADVASDPTILFSGGPKFGAQLLKYAATGKAATAEIQALGRGAAALEGATRILGSPTAGAIYGPEIVEGVLRGVEAGDLPKAAGAAVIGGLMIHGIRKDLSDSFMRPATDREVLAELERLRQQAAAETGKELLPQQEALEIFLEPEAILAPERQQGVPAIDAPEVVPTPADVTFLPTQSSLQRKAEGGKAWHPEYGAVDILAAPGPDGMMQIRTQAGEALAIGQEALETLDAPKIRPHELTVEHQQGLVDELNDLRMLGGAYPVVGTTHAVEVSKKGGGVGRLMVSPDTMRAFVPMVRDAYGDGPAGFTTYPVLDTFGEVVGWRKVWRDRTGEVRGAIELGMPKGLPQPPEHLRELAQKLGNEEIGLGPTPDAPPAASLDPTPLYDWWAEAWREVDGKLRGGDVVVGVDDKLPAGLRAEVTRNLQLEAARQRADRSNTVGSHSEKGYGALFRQALTKEEADAAVRAATYAPEKLVGLVRATDTGRPLTPQEVMRGIIDLTWGAGKSGDSKSYDFGRQFHYEAEAVKRTIRQLMKDGKYEETLGLKVEPLPEGAKIRGRRTDDGTIELELLDKKGQPLDVPEAARRRAAADQEVRPDRGGAVPEAGGSPRAAAEAIPPGEGPPGGELLSGGPAARGVEDPQFLADRADAYSIDDAPPPPLIEDGAQRVSIPLSPQGVARTLTTREPSVGHVQFLGDREYFTREVEGEAHIYRAFAGAPLDDSGQRAGAAWFGPDTPDTRDRLAAMQRVARRERTLQTSMKAGINPAAVVADIVDRWRIRRAEQRARMHGQAEPAANIPPRGDAPPGDVPPDRPPGDPSAPPDPAGDLPKYAGSINLWQRLDHGEDALELFQATYKQFTPLIDEARRGTMTMAQIRQMASVLDSEVDATALALGRRVGTAFNAEKLWAINEGLKETSRATLEHARTFLQTPEAQRTPQMEADLVQALARHTAVFASVSGANTEAGRALGILNRINRAGGDSRKLQDVLEMYGRTRGLSRETVGEIATLLAKIDPEDLRAQGRFVRAVTKPTRRDKIYEYWINSILSGPPTMVANAISGVLGSVLMPVELGLAALGNEAHRIASRVPGASRLYRETGPVQRVRYFGEMREAGKQLLGFLDLPLIAAEKMGLGSSKLSLEDMPYVSARRGVREAAAAALQAFHSEQPVVGEVSRAYETGHPGAIGGSLGRTIRLPSRVLLGTDQFFQALISRMSLNARAYRQAMRELGEKGSREAVSYRMAELLAEPSRALKDAATEEALYRTFNSELTGINADLQRFRRRHPDMGWVVPFFRTPVNIVGFGLERTPGLNLITFGRAMADYHAGKIDAGKLSDETAKTLLGTGLALGVGMLVADGVITGGGPVEPKERKTLEATGWRPYSIRIGENFYGFSRVEPLGVTMSMIADFVELAQVKELDKLPSQLLASITRNLLDKTWISGLTGVFKMVMDWERYGEGWALRTASSFIPNLFAYTERAMDPARTLPESFQEAIVAKLPGGGTALVAAGGEDPTEFAKSLDIYGRRDLLEDTWFERLASPFRRSPVRTDKVTPVLIDLGISLGSPSKRLDNWTDPVTGKELPQPKGQQAEVLARARGHARYALAAMLASDQDFLALPKDDQKEIMSARLSRASAVVTRRAKALLYSGQRLTMEELVGELQEQGPPGL